MRKAALLAGAAALSSAADLQVSVADDGSSYNVSVGGVLWFRSGDSVTPTVAGSDPLKLCSKSNGTVEYPGWGSCSTTTFAWGVDCTSPLVETSVLRPHNLSNAAVFRQRWPQGYTKTDYPARKGGLDPMDDVITAFPQFLLGHDDVPLNAVSWGGNQLADSKTLHWADFGTAAGAAAGVPVLVYDADLNSAVIAPATNPFNGIHAARSNGSVFAAGLQATITTLPPDFVHDTVIYCGQGVHATMRDWGNEMLRQLGKPRPNRLTDYVLSHLGYWTDHGAWYYHVHDGYANAEDALKAVKADFQQRGIPIRYMQWDDWWYVQKGGDIGGLIEWQPPKDVFPSGLTRWLEMPLSLYVAMYHIDNVYINDYPFFKSPATNHSLPSSREFYDALFANGTKAGMVMFEQDFFSYAMQTLPMLTADTTTGMQWLKAMNDAAVDARVSLQYCMMYPQHALASMHFSAVTNGRATRDNVNDPTRLFVLGLSSILLDAVGLWPSRDNVWTNTTEPPQKTRPSPIPNNVIAVLTGGPYGPSDRVGTADAELIMRSCRKDGQLLRPSVPIHAADVAFAEESAFAAAQALNVWQAQSITSGYHWSYLVSLNLNTSQTVPVSNLAPATRHVAWDFWAAARGQIAFNVTAVDEARPLVLPPCPQQGEDYGMNYYVTAPVLESNWVLLGEMSKIVTASEVRFSNIVASGAAMTARVTVTEGEEALVALLRPVDVYKLFDEGTSRVVPVTARCSGAAAQLVCSTTSCGCS
eukprot:TRINITY_DN267_c0_g3_i1.p1 TRINITY_DN267_c0_g3~~TRINITY_DN267_c0_g3_i1.p1  ORF type:complete len:779 (+),score=186.73 TRINITY_DN267_c0_g3_i1:75-2339(+)